MPLPASFDKLREVLVPSAKRDDRLTRLEMQVAYLAERLGVSCEELEAHSVPAAPEEVRRLVADGRQLEAIKVYRESTGARCGRPSVPSTASWRMRS